jgi:hypothetical protein
MEYTLGSLYIPLKKNIKDLFNKFEITSIEDLFNKIGITRFKEMYTVKGKITENVCKNRINMMKHFIPRFEEYISIFQENEEGEIIGIVTFEIEIEYIKIHNLCANVKGVGKLLLDKVKELSNILKIKIVLMPSPVEKVFKYYFDNGFSPEGLHLVHYPDTIKKTFDSKGCKGKTRKSKGGKRKTFKKYITKLKFYTLVPKEKYVPKIKQEK